MVDSAGGAEGISRLMEEAKSVGLASDEKEAATRRARQEVIMMKHPV